MWQANGADGVPAMTDSVHQHEDRTTEARAWDELLGDAVRVLTEAARLRRPVLEHAPDGGWQEHPTSAEPADWAQFVTLAVAGAAANVGGVEKALHSRHGSGEADIVRNMLRSTVGEDPGELVRHRTEPLRVVLHPAEILADLGYVAVYDECQRIVTEQQNQHVWRYQLAENLTWRALDETAPAYDRAADEGTRPGSVLAVPRSEADEQEYHRLLDLEARIEDLRYEGDPRAYGDALRVTLSAKSAELSPVSRSRSRSTRTSASVRSSTSSTGPRTNWSRPHWGTRGCPGVASRPGTTQPGRSSMSSAPPAGFHISACNELPCVNVRSVRPPWRRGGASAAGSSAGGPDSVHYSVRGAVGAGGRRPATTSETLRLAIDALYSRRHP